MKLQILVVLIALAEIAGALPIRLFMALVGDISQLQGDGRLADLYRASGLERPCDFLFWLRISVLCVLLVAARISMFTTWRLSVYGAKVHAKVGNCLFSHFMHQP